MDKKKFKIEGNNSGPIPIKHQIDLKNYSEMKRENKSSEIKKNLDHLIDKLSEQQVLSTRAMSYVKGGTTDGEGNGGAPVLIVPKPPQ
jgi:hypothetical protein